MLLLANSLSSKHDKEKYEPVFFQQSDDLKKSATFIYSQPTDVKQQQTAAEKEASVHISAVNRLNNSWDYWQIKSGCTLLTAAGTLNFSKLHWEKNQFIRT